MNVYESVMIVALVGAVELAIDQGSHSLDCMKVADLGDSADFLLAAYVVALCGSALIVAFAGQQYIRGAGYVLLTAAGMFFSVSWFFCAEQHDRCRVKTQCTGDETLLGSPLNFCAASVALDPDRCTGADAPDLTQCYLNACDGSHGTKRNAAMYATLISCVSYFCFKVLRKSS